MIANKDTFEDVIISAKCKVQLDSHSKLCLCKIGESRKLKSKPKHPFMGRYICSATKLALMTSTRYCDNLDTIASMIPDGV